MASLYCGHMSQNSEQVVSVWAAQFTAKTVLSLAVQALGEGQVRVDGSSEHASTLYRCGLIVTRTGSDRELAHALAHLVLGHSHATQDTCKAAEQGASVLLSIPFRSVDGGACGCEDLSAREAATNEQMIAIIRDGIGALRCQLPDDRASWRPAGVDDLFLPQERIH